MSFDITWRARLPDGTTDVLIPSGVVTPEACVDSVTVTGGATSHLREATTSQLVHHLRPSGHEVEVRWRFAIAPGRYDDALFTAHPSRHTRAAQALLDEVAEIAPDLDPLGRAEAIACATADRFTYGHAEHRFTDGLDEIPALGCGMAVGSCVDINTYFLAALRAAGIQAGYVTGFYFPQEKRGRCDDGHCWIVTRIDGQDLEWDIAHHLKMGTRIIRPGLNPKPGFRAACFHGMGLRFPEVGAEDVKALIEPLCLSNGAWVPLDADIRLHRTVEATP
ncbi:transglutaminase-like domain-containing protein [Sagittula sp. SSi028]|uniref:transglutaminase-like domain-containing protein n=1 Tax=Sagittula sp. SSi028 TaxID=3400636 RepID=UPI003AF5DBAF